MPDEGKYKVLKLDSVKGNSNKIITLLKNTLPGLYKGKRMIVFLGEQHTSTVDQEVTAAMLANPPLTGPAATDNRIIYERGLTSKYPLISHSFGSTRTEGSAVTVGNTARSAIIGDMILDAFANHGVTVIYMPCGSKHATEVFDYVNKRSPDAFDFIYKADDNSS